MRLTPLLVPLVAALGLAGCASPPAPAAEDVLSIVASTNVYGDIASSIGGDGAEVTSIITSEVSDPHGYEATGRDRLAVVDADIVIMNGGGYDHFMEVLLDADDDPPLVLDVMALLGHESEHAEEEENGGEGEEHHHHHDGTNEHVWYEIHTADVLADALLEALGEIAPDSTAVFEANADAFHAAWRELDDRIHALADGYAGHSVAITEPVPLFLFEALGLENLTPPEFSEAVEEDADVPPLILQETLGLIEDGRVAFLAYNPQAATSETEKLREAAEAAGIPVVIFTETLPEGEDYLGWMTDNVDRIATALAS
jgi:zinc/manganese transport system substrate-binding protein